MSYRSGYPSPGGGHTGGNDDKDEVKAEEKLRTRMGGGGNVTITDWRFISCTLSATSLRPKIFLQ